MGVVIGESGISTGRARRLRAAAGKHRLWQQLEGQGPTGKELLCLREGMKEIKEQLSMLQQYLHSVTIQLPYYVPADTASWFPQGAWYEHTPVVPTDGWLDGNIVDAGHGEGELLKDSYCLWKPVLKDVLFQSGSKMHDALKEEAAMRIQVWVRARKAMAARTRLEPSASSYEDGDKIDIMNKLYSIMCEAKDEKRKFALLWEGLEVAVKAAETELKKLPEDDVFIQPRKRLASVQAGFQAELHKQHNQRKINVIYRQVLTLGEEISEAIREWRVIILAPLPAEPP